MDWDGGQITSVNMSNVDSASITSNNTPSLNQAPRSRTEIQNRFREFLRHFRQGTVYLYREQLMSHYRRNLHYLTIDLGHLNAYDPRLQSLLLEKPNENLFLFEQAISAALALMTMNTTSSGDHDDKMLHDSSSSMMMMDSSGFSQPSSNTKHDMGLRKGMPHFQAILTSEQAPTPLRHIHAQELNHLIKIPGIIISAKKVTPKCTSLTIQCRGCGSMKTLSCSLAFGRASIPLACEASSGTSSIEGGYHANGGVREMGNNQCPKDPYLIVPDKCSYVDQQLLKLQENPEVVPTGEMPRSVMLLCDRALVDKVG